MEIFDYSNYIFKKTEEWRKSGGFVHRKPCKEWLEGKRCSHYARARYKHFKSEIDKVLGGIGL